MKSKRFMRGQTLVGTLLAISLGTALLLVLLAWFSKSQWEQKQRWQRLNLQQALQQKLQLIAKDVRRIGYLAIPDRATPILQTNLRSFTQNTQGRMFSIRHKLGENSQSCLVFAYDMDHSGCFGSTFTEQRCVIKGRNNTNELYREMFGFRLNQGRLETRGRKGISRNCTTAQCRQYLNATACQESHWQNVLDEKQVLLDKLHFQLITSPTGQKAMGILLAGHRREQPNIRYETQAFVPLMNEK